MPLQMSADPQVEDDRSQLLPRKGNMKYLLSLGLIAMSIVLASVRHFDRAKVFRVKPQNEKQVSFMKDLASITQLNFWHPDTALHIVSHMEVDFHVSAEQTKDVESLMEQNDMHYEILFQNLQDDIEKQLNSKRDVAGRYSYTKYNEWHKVQDEFNDLKRKCFLAAGCIQRQAIVDYSLIQISAWTTKIVKKNPTLVSRIQIGSTFENRPMHVLKVGNQSGIEKAIFIDCGIHAREWISPAFCQWFLKEATTTYGKDKNMTNILDNMNFYILPVFNIDGYIWSWTQDRLWRKNRSNTSNSACVGVDLNRNFDVAWGIFDTSKNPCEEVYCGSSPESEQETKAVTAFIRSHISSIKAYLTIHSYSQMILFPYGYTYEKIPNHDELNELAKRATEAITSLYGKKYKYGTSATTIYPSSGCSDDWAYDQGIKYSFTFELRDKGRYGFLLPESEIKSTCQETMLAVKLIANYIHSQTS